MADATTRPIVPQTNADEVMHRRQLAVRANASLPKDGTEGMTAPLKLMSYATADLPDPAQHEGEVVYDNESEELKYSDGVAWVTPVDALGHEVGTWTPGLTFGGSSTGWTFDTQEGSFVRIGALVLATFIIEIAGVGSATGIAAVTDFPDESADGPPFVCALEIDGGVTTTLAGGATLRMNANSTSANLRTGATGDSGAIEEDSFQVGTALRATMLYQRNF